jgi:hypothetical protein
MKQQYPLTLITPVLAIRKENLFVFLNEIKKGIEDKMHVSFEDLNTIHFARWLVIDYEKSDEMPKLVYSANFDNSPQEHIHDMCSKSPDIVDILYSCCEGYPLPENNTTEKRIAYLTKWIVASSAFFRGAPMRSLPTIKAEEELHQFIKNYIDSNNWKNKTAVEVHEAIKKEVFSTNKFDFAKEPFTMPNINWFGMIKIGLVMLVFLPFIIIWILIVQFGYERKDKYFTLRRSQLDENKIKKLEEYEDWEMQNQFSQLVEMKTGKVRLFTFKMMMLLARNLIKYQFVKGNLMGIPSIHFARWVLFDNNKRVLFFSNFDGSWQQYLGDFIDKSGWGLTGIFSNTKVFPKTRFLITGGAYDEEHFLAWSRNSEIQTQIWYTAYPHLSIKNINNNSRIRIGLLENYSESEAQRYLKLIN